MLQLSTLKKHIPVVLVVLVLLLPTVFALVHSGFFLSDDGTWMVIRFSAFYESLRQGQFPPRFLVRLNHGYGYPVADFLYPLFMYIGTPLHILGLSFFTTIKIILGASLLSSGAFMYLWLKKFVTVPAAIVGGLLYVLFPYHLWDTYARGSVGEVLALAIVPLTLLQIENGQLLWSGVCIGLLILSHNSLALLFLPLLTLYMYFIKRFNVKQIGFVIIFGLGLSTFFWLPALYDKQFTVFDSIKVSSLFPYFINPTNYSLVGWGSVLVFLLTIPLFLLKGSKRALFFCVVTFGSVVLTLPFTYPLWQVSHIAPLIQFPYRLLSLTMVGVAVLAALEIEILPKKIKIIVVFLLIVVGYISSWNFLSPKTFQDYPDTFYSTNQDSTTVKNEYMPLWVKNQPTQLSSNKLQLLVGEGDLSHVLFNGSTLSGSVMITKKALAQIAIIYFPGWVVKVDGKSIPLSYSNEYGFIQFPLPTGIHTIQAHFTETPLRLVSDITSLLFLLSIPVVYIVAKRKIHA